MPQAGSQPVIASLLDTDLYKFTMMQVILHRFPSTQAEYAFACRNRPEYPLADLKRDLEMELDRLCELRFTAEELEHLRTLRFIKPDFVDFLELFQLQRRFIDVSRNARSQGGLAIHVNAPMLHGMMYEIYVLAIVNELYFRRFDAKAARREGQSRLRAKIEKLRRFSKRPPLPTPFLLFDFGTRRRFSRQWHQEVVETFAREVPEFFKGTSDVDIARRTGLTAIGTMAHEYLQAHQGLGYRLREFQRAALENWVLEYRGDLGIALTDTVGMDAFLRDFDLYFAKLFDGLRHDSGDPIEWGEKAIAHYAALRIEPMSKMLVFSDGLDIDKAIAIYRHFADRAKTSFGVGTHLTNDCGPTPLNIVMKMTRCNDQPVAKLSDTAGKTLCTNRTFLNYLRQVFDLKQVA
jgi:nicotinate phosphoribosyltransferase